MKINRNKPRFAFVAALLAGLAVSTGAAVAADSDKMQEKINLMTAAIQARESGDLQAAKKSLEELIKIAPNEKGVQRVLADVNADIERQQKGEKTVLADSEKVAKVESDKKAVEDAKKAAVEAKEAEKQQAIKAAEESKAQELAALTEKEQKELGEGILAVISEADNALDDGDWQKAGDLLSKADAKFAAVAKVDNKEMSPYMQDLRGEWNRARADLARTRAEIAMAERKPAEAKAFAAEYQTFEADKEAAADFVKKVEEFEANPYNHTIADASPAYAERMKRVEAELRKGRLQYLYGDYQGARTTFRNVETLDSTNVEAKAYQRLVAEKLKNSGKLSYLATRETMLGEVDNAWARPQVFTGKKTGEAASKLDSEVERKLKEIEIANFDIPEPGVPLSRALNTLSILSVDNDKSTSAKKGVNIVLFDESQQPETVNLSLRGETLGAILDILTRKYGYQYDIESEKIIVRKGSEQSSQSMETVDFAITQATVTRMVGVAKSGGDGSPFGGGDGGGEMSNEDSEKKIKAFFEKAGVKFDQGASLAFDGTKLWVTNSSRNLDKVRNILLKYSEVKQVEIEAKFLEVQQGDLKEIAFNWRAGRTLETANALSGGFVKLDETLFATTDGTTRNLRTVSDGFKKASDSSQIGISTRNYKADKSADPTDPTKWIYSPDGTTTEYVPQVYPGLNSALNVGSSSVPTSSALLGVISGYTVELLVNALEQKTGSDLLCAPKVTVLSGTEARITVSQQMYYAESWGDMQSQVSSSGSSSSTTGGGSSEAAITITPGTPQDFKTYDVGVVMTVSPNVEEDGSINLALSPRVSDFEGFMAYGGTAVGIAGGYTVTVPAGFIMPVFSVREVSTNVTIFDGATVVLGGLTREEVVKVDDSVPLLSDIPLVGRLFKSKGESRQKRNLMIFVTANRISPGGSVHREQFADMRPGSVYQNPTIVSPGGAVQRLSEEVSALENN